MLSTQIAPTFSPTEPVHPVSRCVAKFTQSAWLTNSPAHIGTRLHGVAARGHPVGYLSVNALSSITQALQFARQCATRGGAEGSLQRHHAKNSAFPPLFGKLTLSNKPCFQRLSAVVCKTFSRSRFALCRNLVSTRRRMALPLLSSSAALASSLWSVASAKRSCFITRNMALRCHAVKRRPQNSFPISPGQCCIQLAGRLLSCPPPPLV